MIRRKFCPDACPRLHVVLQVILARKWLRMQICKVAELQKFLGVTPPNPRPVLGHRAVLFPDSRCFGSHNFQIVPARLSRVKGWHIWNFKNVERLRADYFRSMGNLMLNLSKKKVVLYQFMYVCMCVRMYVCILCICLSVVCLCVGKIFWNLCRPCFFLFVIGIRKSRLCIERYWLCATWNFLLYINAQL